MGEETDHGRIQPGPEHRGGPPKVDFKELAESAISGGLFNVDQTNLAVNRGIRSENSRLPITLIDTPYPDGPVVIEEWEEDVPEASMYAVRKNFIEANRLLLPKDKVMAYFHHRFVAGNVFESDTLRKIAGKYRPPSVRSSFGDKFKNPSLSFKVEGEERKSVHRDLFTQEEVVAGLELVRDHPEVVLSVTAYQSVVQDFLGELKGQFEASSRQPYSVVNEKALKDFDKYIQQWGTSNFTRELIPAIAIFIKLKRDQNPDLVPDQEIDGQIFQQATEFIISNGVFRNWVKVPEYVAADNKERINHFLCPAVGTIREQLMDGSVLGMIYQLARKKAEVGDPVVTSSLEQFRSKATKNLTPEKRKEITREDMEKWYEEQKKVHFNYNDKDYLVKVDNTVQQELQGNKERDDIEVEPIPGDMLYEVIQNAIRLSLIEGKPVFFKFDDNKFRITPEKVMEIVDSIDPSEPTNS